MHQYGHKVKVKTADDWILNVKTNVTLKDNLTIDSVKNEILQAIKNYYNEIIKNEWESGEWTVRVSQVENRILNIDGVIDINDTTLLYENEYAVPGNYNGISTDIPKINKVIINEVTIYAD